MGILFTYSFIIAYGRALPRGLDYVFNDNVYYSYIACLVVIVALSVYFINSDDARNEIEFENSSKENNHNYVRIFRCRSLFYLALILVIIFNSYYTSNLAKAYRYNFSQSRLEVINSVRSWIQS